MKNTEVTHRTVVMGEVMSAHTSYELALMAAKKLANKYDSKVFIEGWETVAVIPPDVKSVKESN